MHTTAAMMFGVALGLLFACLFALGHLSRYVESDVQHFTRWLDKGGTP
jgi:hypothetical protein